MQSEILALPPHIRPYHNPSEETIKQAALSDAIHTNNWPLIVKLLKDNGIDYIEKGPRIGGSLFCSISCLLRGVGKTMNSDADIIFKQLLDHRLMEQLEEGSTLDDMIDPRQPAPFSYRTVLARNIAFLQTRYADRVSYEVLKNIRNHWRKEHCQESLLAVVDHAIQNGLVQPPAQSNSQSVSVAIDQTEFAAKTQFVFDRLDQLIREKEAAMEAARQSRQGSWSCILV